MHFRALLDPAYIEDGGTGVMDLAAACSDATKRLRLLGWLKSLGYEFSPTTAVTLAGHQPHKRNQLDRALYKQTLEMAFFADNKLKLPAGFTTPVIAALIQAALS